MEDYGSARCIIVDIGILNFEQFKNFEEAYTTQKPRSRKKSIGGHEYNITSWTRKARAEAAFDNKDPIPDDIVKAIRRGESVMLGPG